MKTFLFASLLFSFSLVMNVNAANKNIKAIYEAKSNYAHVKFYTLKNDNDTLYVKAKFFDVSDVSGIHIHTNENGNPGPIIAWLATSKEWQHGVLQNTPLTNGSASSYFCCIKQPKHHVKNLCSLIAPPGTPLTKDLSHQERRYKIVKNVCSSCPWISNGTFLDIHGKNFQQVYGCKVVGDEPGIDMIDNVKFKKIKMKEKSSSSISD